MTNQLPNDGEVMLDDSSFNEQFEASGELIEDFTDEELLKLYVLHFREDDDRSTEEMLQLDGKLQQALFAMAKRRGYQPPDNRHFVTFMMFNATGPWSPSNE